MRVEDRADQLRLGEPLPYQDAQASKEAARAMREPAATQRLRVLASLKDLGPATDEELQRRLSMNPSSERPRRIELVRLGLVRECGHGVTSSGRKATKWEAC